MALEDLFTGIAGAIRQKDGTSGTIVANDFPSRILAIPSLEASGTLEYVSIDNPPYKTRYKVGESFDPTGMIVSAHLDDGENIVLSSTSLVFLPPGPLAATDTQVTVSVTIGGVTKTAAQPVAVLSAFIVGVAWDASNPSTEMTRLTTESDPKGYVNTDITEEPAPALGAEEGSSPFDSIMPWSGMEEYNIIDGAVAYKRGDSGFSRSSYDTMVYIPEFWYKTVFEGSKRYYYVSSDAVEGFEKHPGSGKYVGRYKTGAGYVSKTGLAPLVNITRAAARTGSTGKGSKWCQYDFASWCAVEYLFKVEFASYDSQSKIGRGYVDGNTSAINNGGTDSMNYHTGQAAGTGGKTSIQYRHIENPYGVTFEWVDGINIGERVPYICLDLTKYADDTTANYTNSGGTLPTSNGFTKDVALSNTFHWSYLPGEIGGSDATYIPDYTYTNTGWRVLCVGGYWSSGSLAGLWYFNANYASSGAHAGIGARLLYNP